MKQAFLVPQPGFVAVACTILIAASMSQPPLRGGDTGESEPIAWATDAEFRQRLAQPVDVFWSGAPLRNAVAGLSRAQHVAVLIDRRVDPSQKLDMAIKGDSLESVLRTIAERSKLDVALLDSVVYLGPPSAAERLRPVAAALERAVRRLPKDAQQGFNRADPLAWDDLATPRELLSQLASQNGLQCTGLERVPHDLWAAAQLPACSLVDRLTLLAIQFDLAFAISHGGKTLTLVPIPENLPVPPSQKRRGSSEERPGTKPAAADPSVGVERVRVQRMTVQAEPLGRVLRQLASRLGLELRIDEKAIQEAGISLDQAVSLKVENATIDDLLRELLKSSGLTFHRRDRVVEIAPAKRGNVAP